MLSYFSAKVVDSFRKKDPLLTIHYFCDLTTDGLITDDKSHYVDPVGMMRSLLSQLLRQKKFDFDLSGITEHELSAGLEQQPLKTTSVLFACLLKQLPCGKAVALVINDVSSFEDRERYRDTRKTIKHIARSMGRSIGDGNVVFKVLITSSCKSKLRKECRKFFTGKHEIFLKKKLADDDRQGYEEEAMDEDMAF